jgi:putative DNA primase/helicase
LSGVLTFPSAASAEELAGYPMNDLGNGMRLMRLVGCRPSLDGDGDWDHSASTLLYLRNRGWIAFNGRYWDLAGGEEAARRFAHRVAAGLMGQGAAAGAKGVPIAAWMKFATSSGSSGSSAAMLAQAASYLAVDLTDFDRDPLALNVANGTLKFAREAGAAFVRFEPTHNPADRITRICEARWEPGAKAPLFEGHVAWCQTAPEMQRYLQKLLGYGMTGVTKEQLFVIFQGKGGDGKSTLINAVRAVAGSYSVGAAIETFLDAGMRRGAEASPDLARLAGDSRFICTAEPPRGSKLAAATIKAFTGGGTIQARELRQGIFEFTPLGKVFLECNSRPVINDTDDGIWRRIRILLFENQLSKDQIDQDLPDKLRAERDGILSWLVEGVIAWMDEGLATPEAVTAALDDYRRGSNPFAEWVADRTIREASAWTSASALYADYKSWCDDNGVDRPMTQTTFGRALGDMQFIAKKDSAGKKVRRGIRLRTAADGGLGLGAGVSPGGPSLEPDPFGPPEFD